MLQYGPGGGACSLTKNDLNFAQGGLPTEGGVKRGENQPSECGYGLSARDQVSQWTGSEVRHQQLSTSWWWQEDFLVLKIPSTGGKFWDAC